MKNFINTLLLFPTIVFAQSLANTQPTAQPQEPQSYPTEHLFPAIESASGKLFAGFWENHWYWILILIIVFGVLLWILLNKKKPLPTPYEIAMISLNSKELETLESKPYAQTVSNVVRNYIEAVHNIPAPERTTEEFILIASNSDKFDTQTQNLLSELLKKSDLVKFSRAGIESQARKSLLESSIKFVEEDNRKLTDKKSEVSK